MRTKRVTCEWCGGPVDAVRGITVLGPEGGKVHRHTNCHQEAVEFDRREAEAARVATEENERRLAA